MAEIVGQRSLTRDLLAFADDVGEHRPTNRSAGLVVLKAARPETPRDRGALVRTGKHTADRSAATVMFGSASVRYAAAHHFGSNPRPQGGFVEANPWLYDAAETEAETVAGVYADRVERLAKKF